MKEGNFQETFDVMLDGGKKVCEHAIEKWSGDSYGGDEAMKQKNLKRWDTIKSAIRMYVPARNIPLSELKPHPQNAVIYADSADDELIESIEKLDVLQPLVITFDKRIVSGHRRFDAYQRLGYTEVPCVEFPSRDETDILEALVMLNRQREKTSEQIAREAEVLMQVERERARSRMLATQNNRAARQHVAYPVTQGKSTDVVGEKLGVSGETIRRSIKVVEKIDELTNEGETEKALELRTTLNTSVSKAHSQVKAMEIVEAEKGQLVIDVDDAKGAEKAVWDYTQANSMAVRWRSFVKELLQMSKFRSRLSGTLITMISW